VIGTTRSKDKIQRLRQAGAEYALLESDLDTEVLRLAPKGADVIVELVGCDQIQRDLQWCALHGVVVLAGILNRSLTTPDFSPIMIPTGRNLSFGSLTNTGCGDPELGASSADVELMFAHAIESIQSGQWKKHEFIDTLYKLPEIGKAHERAEKDQAVGRLAVVV
jgi:NADPH2:quinone reductase